MKKKRNLRWPWEEQTIWVENRLKKKIYVMIMPNPDYVMGEILVSFASIGSGALGIVKTASDLLRVLRCISLIKNAKDIIDKLKGVVPKSALTLHPNSRMEVYNAWFNDPGRFLNPVTATFEMFGGKTKTIIITDEDFKNTVMFNTEVTKTYYVDETGVAPPMHYWNGGHVTSGLLSSTGPSLIRMSEDEMLMAYRHYKGERIYIAELEQGSWHTKGRGWLNCDSKEGIGVTSMQGNLCLVARDHQGDQMFSLWQPDKHIPFDAGRTWMGPDIQGKPSATTVGDTTYFVAKHYPGNAVMWAIRSADGHTESGNTGLNTKHSPSIHAYKGKLYLFFARMDTQQICVAVSSDGREWKEVRNDLHQTNAAVALTIYKDRLYVFYRDVSGNGVFYMWTKDGSTFEDPRDRYFGFDVAGPPTASPMPGENGIMVAGILTAEWQFSDPASFPDSEAIIWTILMPWEPPKSSVPIRTITPRVRPPKKAAKKSSSKKAATKKSATKKTEKSKGKATTKAKKK